MLDKEGTFSNVKCYKSIKYKTFRASVLNILKDELSPT